MSEAQAIVDASSYWIPPQRLRENPLAITVLCSTP
jgi:hypothetical protein